MSTTLSQEETINGLPYFSSSATAKLAAGGLHKDLALIKVLKKVQDHDIILKTLCALYRFPKLQSKIINEVIGQADKTSVKLDFSMDSLAAVFNPPNALVNQGLVLSALKFTLNDLAPNNLRELIHATPSTTARMILEMLPKVAILKLLRSIDIEGLSEWKLLGLKKITGLADGEAINQISLLSSCEILSILRQTQPIVSSFFQLSSVGSRQDFLPETNYRSSYTKML